MNGGDESGNGATTAGIKPSDSVSWGKHNGQKLAVGLGSARETKATNPSPRGRHRGRGDTAGKKRPSPDCACPPWSFERRMASFVMTRDRWSLEPHEGQAGRWHGPCPDAGTPRLEASPPSLRDDRDARCKRIPRPNGRATRHTPRGADVSRTNPVSPRRTPSGKRDVASGDTGPARCPALESSPFRARRMSILVRRSSGERERVVFGSVLPVSSQCPAASTVCLRVIR